MRLDPNVFDAWVWRTAERPEYLLLHTSQAKADRHFNGGLFWQIPSGFVSDGERVTDAVDRVLSRAGLESREIWAAEYVYNIYNRRFDAMQMIGVYAARVDADLVTLDPEEHDEYRWCTFEEALRLVNFRGLKEGLSSVREYVTERAAPMRELRLK